MLARAGADVACVGRSPGPLEEAAAEIRIADRALSELGLIDVWVNNAGSAARSDGGRPST
jgi:3-oxoacyl-[acyl-carrier protein] reductase